MSLKIIRIWSTSTSVTTVRWCLSKVVDWEITLMSCMAILSPLMKFKSWQWNLATPRLQNSQINRIKLWNNGPWKYVHIKDLNSEVKVWKFQATADPHCFQAVRWGKDRGDQGVKTLSGDNSHTPLIVGPNLGVNVVGERLSTKDPNGGEERRKGFKLNCPQLKLIKL